MASHVANWSTPQLDSLDVEVAFGETSDDDCAERLLSLLVQNATLQESSLALSGFKVTTSNGAFPPVESNHLSTFALLVHKCDLSSGTTRMLE
jgi:hypothetical protein